MKNYEALLGNLNEFEKQIGYIYKNKDNALLALTHSSYANENKSKGYKSNERLEFLGDAVLNIAVSEKIYTTYSQLSEGEMTKIRASVVCETTLVKRANSINLGNYLLLGKGEELTGGRTRVSILSDAFEAVIGSIYLDGGMMEAKNFIYTQLDELIDSSINGCALLDYKTLLQETLQKNSDSRIVYEIVQEKGPDHNKHFVSQVKANEKILGAGEGRSKKEAEQAAAKAAYEMHNLKQYKGD